MEGEQRRLEARIAVMRAQEHTRPRLLLTPHIGYVTEQTYRAYYGGTLEAILAWLEGRKHNVIGAPGGE